MPTVLTILVIITFILGLAAIVYGMKKYGAFSIIVSLSIFALPAHSQLRISQESCNSIVSDYSGILQKNSGQAQIEQAAQALINQGADIRVVSIPDAGGNLDKAESAFEKTCPQWQGANGGRKSTLIVLMVSTGDRKLGIYYGAAWHKALDDHWNRIKTDYMLPRFKSGDFVGGFVATEQQLAARMIASKDEALKPVVNSSTTVNQATDYSGLWHVLTWLFIFMMCGAGAWIIVYAIRRRKEEKAIVDAGQQKAIAEMNKAASGINSLREKIETQIALGEDMTTAQSCLTSASDEYTRLSSNLKTDPNTDGMDISVYGALWQQYNWINNRISSGLTAISETKKDNKHQSKSEQKRMSHFTPRKKESITPAPAPTATPISTTPKYEEPTTRYEPPSSNVVIVDNSTYIQPTPRYTPPVYEEPVEPVRYTPEPEPERYHHSSSDDSGGGSSSWGSSSSSSDDDSGGSSSFDSGSSDSGGGGSDSF